MALGEFMTRKWVRPFMAFFALTLVSLLAFGSITSRIGVGVMYVKRDDHRTRNRTQKTMEQTASSRSIAYKSLPERLDPTVVSGPKVNDQKTLDNSSSVRDIVRKPSISNISTSISLASSYHFESSDGEFVNQIHRTPQRQHTRQAFISNTSDIKVMSERTSPKVTPVDSTNNLYSKNERTKEKVRSKTEKPVFIVLMGRMRTGSTLIGEIFNQNPSIGFLYEPLHAVCDWNKKGTINKSHFTTVAASLLRKISSCEFPPNFISSIIKWPTGGGFRSSMIHPVCAVTSSCKRATSSMLRHQCLKYKKYRGIKTIRADLNLLLRLIELDTVDVKILHLIRDPRGVANSRRQVYSVDSNAVQRRLAARGYRKRILHDDRVSRDDQFANPFPEHARRPMSLYNYHFQPPISRGTRLDILGLMDTSDVFPLLNTMPAYCKWLDSTITLAQKRPDWLKGRYKLIRYEDYAASPLSVTEDVYRYFDMHLPDKVRRWVANNTESDVLGGDKLYGSHKNSSEAAFKWRTSMTSKEALQVEEVCGSIMERLGYRQTSSRVRLEDLEQSLFLPLPDDIPREL